MDTFKLDKMPDEQVRSIVRLIKERRSSSELAEVYINPILREDILTLLDRYCTVIYYPVSDQNNNGFHVRYPSQGGDVDFVYINTNQAKEKQIFTAAHELGHIWGVDRYLKDELGIELDHDQEEAVMNRFAAELLMPEELCRSFVRRKISELPHEKDSMRILDLLHLVVAVMNEYFVPYKAVVLRLFELNIIPEASAKILLEGTTEVSVRTIRTFLKNLAQVEGYSRLFKEDRLKRIEGLKERLDQAEGCGTMSAARIAAIRNRFDLNAPEPDKALSNPVSVQEKERADSDVETGHH